jgi:hypothetical protein
MIKTKITFVSALVMLSFMLSSGVNVLAVTSANDLTKPKIDRSASSTNGQTNRTIGNNVAGDKTIQTPATANQNSGQKASLNSVRTTASSTTGNRIRTNAPSNNNSNDANTNVDKNKNQTKPIVPRTIQTNRTDQNKNQNIQNDRNTNTDKNNKGDKKDNDKNERDNRPDFRNNPNYLQQNPDYLNKHRKVFNENRTYFIGNGNYFRNNLSLLRKNPYLIKENEEFFRDFLRQNRDFITNNPEIITIIIANDPNFFVDYPEFIEQYPELFFANQTFISGCNRLIITMQTLFSTRTNFFRAHPQLFQIIISRPALLNCLRSTRGFARLFYNAYYNDNPTWRGWRSMTWRQ